MVDKLQRLIADLANVWRSLRRTPVPVPVVNSKSPSRRGISLLEVLISMFVLMIGLLGAAALIPVGKFEQLRGTKIDMSSACGRAAFREVRVRGLVNPLNWSHAGGNLVYVMGEPVLRDATGGTMPMQALAIDPLGIGDGGARSFGEKFPANSTTYSMPRLTLGPRLTPQARAALADMIFRCQDDLALDDTLGGDNLWPQSFSRNSSGDAIKRQSTGDYSWLLTIVPERNATSIGTLVDLPVRASVAVFYKRDLQSQPGAGERVCELVNPLGNGETQLKVTSANVASQYSGDGVKHLDIKPGQWIMVAGCPDTSVNPQQWQYSWQRVVSADEAVATGSEWTRYVTLAGPDQQYATGPNPANIAFLFDGIIAVYEKNMKLEFDSIYQ